MNRDTEAYEDMSDEEAFRIVLELAGKCPLDDENDSKESERREAAIRIAQNGLRWGLGYKV